MRTLSHFSGSDTSRIRTFCWSRSRLALARRSGPLSPVFFWRVGYLQDEARVIQKSAGVRRVKNQCCTRRACTLRTPRTFSFKEVGRLQIGHKTVRCMGAPTIFSVVLSKTRTSAVCLKLSPAPSTNFSTMRSETCLLWKELDHSKKKSLLKFVNRHVHDLDDLSRDPRALAHQHSVRAHVPRCSPGTCP